MVLNSVKLRQAFGVDMSPYHLVATDADFDHGDGQPLHLPAKDLLLIVTARRQPPTLSATAG